MVAEPVVRGLPLVREHRDEVVSARLEGDEPLVDVRQHGALVRAGDERRVHVLDVADGADAQDSGGPGRSERRVGAEGARESVRGAECEPCGGGALQEGAAVEAAVGEVAHQLFDLRLLAHRPLLDRDLA